MARRKRIVLEGPAAEAVELLARSAGITPAELVKRALLREEEAQRAPEAPAQSLAQRLADDLMHAAGEQHPVLLNPQDWPASRTTLAELRAAAGLAHNPELASNPESERVASSPSFRYVLALDANHTLHVIGPPGDLELRKSPTLDSEVFADLVDHLRHALADQIDEITDIATLQPELPGLEQPTDTMAFSSRTYFSLIVAAINGYFAAKGFTDKITLYDPFREGPKQTGSAEREGRSGPRP